MTTRYWRILTLWLLVALALLVGCTAGDGYRSAGSADAYVSSVPPALRGTDPALRHWYTAPYFDPYEMP